MKHSLPESQKEIVIALYQYLAMNAEQLSILLNYNRRTVYNMISELRKQGWVRDVGLGFLGHNHRAYTLTFEGARRTSLLYNQPFQPHIWKYRIVGSERTHFINEFMTQLIVWSSEEDDEGLINWMGAAEAAESHALYDGKTGKRKLRLKPEAVGTYVCHGGSGLCSTWRSIWNRPGFGVCRINFWIMEKSCFNYGARNACSTFMFL